MLCQQKESLAALKEELSQKLSKLTALIRSADKEPTIYDPGFAMPWAQMQMPFQMMNPFSFLMDSSSKKANSIYAIGMPAFGVAGHGSTQNNFYGATSFNAFKSMPVSQYHQPFRSELPTETEQQLLVPYFNRSQIADDSSVIKF